MDPSVCHIVNHAGFKVALCLKYQLVQWVQLHFVLETGQESRELW